MLYRDIFSFVTAQEANYKLPIPVSDGYEWNMYEHVRQTILYKNSKFTKGKNDNNRPFKNIILPLLRVQYRTEGFDVKDIELFIDDPKEYFKSFLLRKYHEKWAREEEIDSFIDEMVESYVDFGGALIKDISNVRPEVVPLQSIAFCDQTDMLSGPIGIKHFFAPDQLLEMEKKGWGKVANGATASLQDVIVLADNSKAQTNLTEKADTPGKYVEVYEVHGMFPEHWIEGDSEAYSRQLHIVTFYADENGEKHGITLFRGKEDENPFKAILRDKIYGRALGLGGVEELFDAQLWTNYDQLRIKGMLDQASKVLYKTTDETFANRNKTAGLENGEILVLAEGKDIGQIDTTPRNVALFEQNVQKWEQSAQQLSGATDALMGNNPTSGTPFKLQDLVTQEGMGIHEYRRGKIATFLEQVYRDWIIPSLSTEVTKGVAFLSELSLDELQQVAQSIAECRAYDTIKERILSGELIDRQEIEAMKQEAVANFMKGGNKRFIEIAKEEMKDAPMDVYVNIAGKQKNMAQVTDKLVNIFRQIIAAPQVLDDPRMAKLFNQILEYSGLNPMDFSAARPTMQQPVPQAQTAPLQDLASQNA